MQELLTVFGPGAALLVTYATLAVWDRLTYKRPEWMK
jgi:hypothetical protein